MKKWFAVIGDPIEHSQSPQMHNAWFNELAIDASYIPIHVKPADLAQAVASLKLLGASGWNVTIPHKSAIIPLLDEVDDFAQKMGAVNTVVRQPNGKLKGYNTDGSGFVHSLEDVIGDTKREAAVLFVGAGGAARGIAFAMQQQGYHNITIANRTVARAEKMIDELGEGKAISLQQAEATLGDYQIIIQMTSAGLNSDTFSMPFSLKNLQAGAVVADIVYTSLETPFLQAAKAQGATLVNGVGMFVQQGAIAFEYWLQQKPDVMATIAKLGGTTSYVNR